MTMAAEEVSPSFQLTPNKEVLAVGAHWDDILLGCLGTLLRLRLVEQYSVSVAVLCARYGDRYYGHSQPALRENTKNIYDVLSQLFEFQTEFIGYQTISDRDFSKCSGEVDGAAKCLFDRYRDVPLVFMPPSSDAQEDHSMTGKAIVKHFRSRSQTLLEYEIKKHTERHFSPNVFFSLDRAVLSGEFSGVPIGDLKVQLLSMLVTGVDDRETARRLSQSGAKIGTTNVAGSGFLFDVEALSARLRMNALDFSNDRDVRSGEVFRGRIAI